MGRVPLWKRSGDDDEGYVSTPTITTRPTSTPIITLDDGRTVPAIMLDNGVFLTPTIKPNGDIETDRNEYTSLVTPSSTPSMFPEMIVTTMYSLTGTEGSMVPYLTRTIYPPASFAASTITTSVDSSSSSSPSIVPTGQITNSPESDAYDAGYNERNFWDNFSEGVKAAIVIAIVFGFLAAVVSCVWICCRRPRRKKGEKERESMRLDMERELVLDRNSTAPLGASVEQLGVPLRAMRTASREREEARLQDSNPTMRGGTHTTHGSISRVASRLSRHMSLRSGGGFNDAPPMYEEVVPPAHQHLAGGRRHVNNNPIQQQPHQFQHTGNFGNDEDDGGAGLVADGKMPLSEIPFEDVVLEQTRSEGSSSRDFESRHQMAGGDTRGHTNS